MKQNLDTHIQIRLSNDQKVKVNDIAKEYNTTVSDLIRTALAV